MTGMGDSGWATWAAGDSGTSMDVLTVRDEVTLRINDITATYSDAATNQAELEVYDDDEGTTAGNLVNQIGDYQLAPGDTLAITDIIREDVEHDIVAVVRNNDDDFSLTIGAEQVS